jgi:DNA modification methylase
MDLRHGDCLEVMSELEDNSVDLMFADLPYGQTSCKWDSLIDLEQFWKQVNRVCKPDAPMVFTCTVKFGNSLINSNPKNFRYDLIWVKSAPCGFLNAKKMPMKKHEMIYVFYNKLPKIYTENIALHHKHKFLKERTNDKNSVIKEEKSQISKKANAGENNLYGDMVGGTIGNVHGTNYEPPLPNSVIKEDTGVYNECDHSSSKKLVRDTKKYKNESVLYGEIDRPNFIMRKNRESIYEPSLPNSILEVKSEKGKHATQKPVALMEWILKYYSREGGVVLDPTMGSGSMGVACEKQNRLFIGVEKDETIYNVALERCGL